MPRKQGLAKSHKLGNLSEHLCRNTHFSFEECKTLLLFHQRLEELGPLDRTRFREILCIVFAITDDVMLDLVFHAFDRDNDGFVDDIEWIRGLSIMLRGTLDELIEYTYFVYDMNGDRSLAREELHHCLKGCMYTGFGIDDDEIEDCERDIVEIAMRKLDTDHDGQITYEDFFNAVHLDPLILQACGPCLPTASRSAAFLSLATDRYRYCSRNLYPGITAPTSRRHRSKQKSTGQARFAMSEAAISMSTTSTIIDPSLILSGAAGAQIRGSNKARALSLSVVRSLAKAPSNTKLGTVVK